MKSALELAMERAERPVPRVAGASYQRRAMGFMAPDAWQGSGEYSGGSIGFGRESKGSGSSGDCRSMGFLQGRAA